MNPRDTPAWALRLMREVCAEYHMREPKLVWRWGSSLYSSGHAQPHRHRIVVTAGRELADQRLVLLHELAHLLTQRHCKRPQAHNRRYWNFCFTLFRDYGVAWHLAKHRSYRQMADKVLADYPCWDDEWGIVGALHQLADAVQEVVTA